MSSLSQLWGVFGRLSRCHGNFSRHKNDEFFFSNNWCLIWYHNIPFKSLSVVVSILLIRMFLSSAETGLSHLKINFQKIRKQNLSVEACFTEIPRASSTT